MKTKKSKLKDMLCKVAF